MGALTGHNTFAQAQGFLLLCICVYACALWAHLWAYLWAHALQRVSCTMQSSSGCLTQSSGIDCCQAPHHSHTVTLAALGLQVLQTFREACCTGDPAPSASPSSDDPMETDAPAASDTVAQMPTVAEAAAPAPPTEVTQDMDTTSSDQPAAPATATTTQAVAKLPPVDPDAASYLPDCVTHTAKLLESMFSNHDTCSKFVQQGGVEVLLQLYTLPKLPPTFGSSSASHSLLAMFRSLTAHNAPDISVRLQPALAAQFEATLSTAEVCLTVWLVVS